jgi:flagellar biosynthesis protein FlhG
MNDQARKLREIIKKNVEPEAEKLQNHRIKVYSIVSGKGGVGKSCFAVNLAISLQQHGKRVLILDADVGMSNAHLLMGVNTKYSLIDLITDNLDLREIIVKGPAGVDLISGGKDMFLLEKLSKDKQEEIIDSLASLNEYDVLLIDNGAGITKQSLTFTILADEVLLITTPEPTALTDAYRVLKIVSVYEINNKVKVAVNQVPNKEMGEEAFNKLLKTTENFLNIKLEKLGYIFSDIRVGKAVMQQVPLLLGYPDALASENINQITSVLLGGSDYKNDTSSIKQFKNRLIKLFG